MHFQLSTMNWRSIALFRLHAVPNSAGFGPLFRLFVRPVFAAVLLCSGLVSARSLVADPRTAWPCQERLVPR